MSLTWIEARSPEEADEIRGISRPLAAELTKGPGCVSWLGCGIGNRLYTITAWESVDAVQQVWRSSLHDGAVKRFFADDFAAAIGTAVFSVDHVNALWMRCTACAKVVNRTENATCPCGQPLPRARVLVRTPAALPQANAVPAAGDRLPQTDHCPAPPAPAAAARAPGQAAPQPRLSTAANPGHTR